MQRWMYGKRNDQIVRDYYGEGITPEEVDARGRDKERLHGEMLPGRTEEDVVPVLRAFLERYRDLPMGVGSNAEPQNIALVLDETGLRHYFRAVVDGHQVRHPKPPPAVYLRVAELLETDPAECVVFEDSHSGAAAAVAAGMRVIGISTTDDSLSGTSITIDNFRSRNLDSWLQAQIRPA